MKVRCRHCGRRLRPLRMRCRYCRGRSLNLLHRGAVAVTAAAAALFYIWVS